MIFLGVFLRKLESGLRGISHVVVDEIHERDINVSNYYNKWGIGIVSSNALWFAYETKILSH